MPFGHQAFAEVISADPFDPDDEDDWARLGAAFTGLLADHDSLLVMMHGFAAGGFIAQGMLLNVMHAMHAPHHLDEDRALGELTRCEALHVFPEPTSPEGAV